MAGTKISPQTIIRRLRKDLDKTSKERDKYKAQGIALEITLNEARRRTIPFRDGSGSLNFLPLCITSFEKRRDSRVDHSWNGKMLVSYAEVEVNIRAIGVVIQHKE